MTPAASMEQMISQQVRTWEVLDERTLDAMRRVPREPFAPPAWSSLAYAELALPLPRGKHMLTPMLAGRILQAVAPQAGERVLEVGTGSGYLTACLAALDADVRSIELHDDLAAMARHNLQAVNFHVEVIVGDGMQLLDESIGCDCLVLTASLPLWQPQLARALKVGGRMFAVVGTGPAMQARLIQRLGAEDFQQHRLFETELEALEHAPAPAPFKF